MISVIFALNALLGAQILHSKIDDKPYQRSEQAISFCETYLKNAVRLDSDAEVLRYASDHVAVNGKYLELGVWKGRTVNFIAALNPHKKIYGFDSFTGLPEDWDKGDKIFPKGLFAWPSGQEMPLVLLNVEIIPGLFEDTLPLFVQHHLQNSKIAFVHIDCDIYSSTATALDTLGPYMVDGTVLVFDEMYNYPNYKNHEWKAFQEFLDKFSMEAEYLAFNPMHEQVAVKLCYKGRGTEPPMR